MPNVKRSRNVRSPHSAPFIVCATAILTLAITLVWRNLAGNPKEIHHAVERLYSTNDPDFLRAMGIALGPSIVGGNRVDVLLNGDEIFPAMLGAIRSAKETITFETYIYWSGKIGNDFAQALAERARAGVRVHVLVDWLGSHKMDTKDVTLMEQAGVQFRKYRPLSWYELGRLNNRSHRKLLVVDGRVAFTGGVGIADVWTGHAQDPDHWRDSHYRVEGPVVAQMQAAFMDNWIKTTGVVLHGPQYFPALESAGSDSAQLFSSSPAGGSESMQLMYLLALTAAKESILLESSYFVPDRISREALVAAVRRGVKVQIITPGPHVDAETVRRASRALWGDLLEAGVEIYEYQPTMFHCKLLIVDQRLVSVGSTNFDPRSFKLNDEASLNIYDAGLAQQETEIFRNDLGHSQRITFAQWRARPLREKLWEKAASLLGPAL